MELEVNKSYRLLDIANNADYIVSYDKYGCDVQPTNDMGWYFQDMSDSKDEKSTIRNIHRTKKGSLVVFIKVPQNTIGHCFKTISEAKEHIETFYEGGN
jgi:hypothetical protein